MREMKVKNTGKYVALSFFGFVSASIVITSVIWPEDFAMALVGLVVGLFTGITLATILMESYFSQGVTMAYELQKKSIVNPVSAMREFRMQEEKNQSKNSTPPPTTAIPTFDITGLGE